MGCLIRHVWRTVKKNIYNTDDERPKRKTKGDLDQSPSDFSPASKKPLKNHVIEMLATGFYFGRMPFMPGTWGTLWGIPLVFFLFRAGPIVYMGVTLVFLLVSIFIAEAYEKIYHSHDPKEIVIDEIVGFAITMTWLPMTWQALLAGFIAFRFFDILKPFPISYIDRKVEGGLGTVLDDAVAGVFANIILQIVFTHTNWLGMQLHGYN